MCYNCGCGMLDNDMGNPDNITTKDFEKAAEASNESEKEAKEKTYEALKKELGK